MFGTCPLGETTPLKKVRDNNNSYYYNNVSWWLRTRNRGQHTCAKVDLSCSWILRIFFACSICCSFTCLSCILIEINKMKATKFNKQESQAKQMKFSKLPAYINLLFCFMLQNHIYPKKVHTMINNKSNNAHLFIEVIWAKNSTRYCVLNIMCNCLNENCTRQEIKLATSPTFTQTFSHRCHVTFHVMCLSIFIVLFNSHMQIYYIFTNFLSSWTTVIRLLLLWYPCLIKHLWPSPGKCTQIIYRYNG